MRYSQFFVERDFIKQRKHIYYLFGNVEKENCGYVVASYSLKNDRIIIKDIECLEEYAHLLPDFVKIAKERYNKI